MPRKGLTKEVIIDNAIQTIESNGYADFSLRSLAATLNVTVSSLYNHIQGQEELLAAVGLRAVDILVGQEEQAIGRCPLEQALYALADAYRTFALEHKSLYQIVMGIPRLSDPVLTAAAERIAKPILQVFAAFGLDEEEQIHYQRVLRSVMHGFIAHEIGGGFSRTSFDRNTSYRTAIRCIISDIRQTKGSVRP